MAYQDPKSGGDTYGNSEVLTSAQMNRIIENQRHFAMSRWFGVQELTDVDAANILDSDLFEYDASGPNYLAWVSANSADVANVGTALGALPNMQDTAHGQSTTGITTIRTVASRPGDAAWFGVGRNSATTNGYIRWTGPGGAFSIHEHAFQPPTTVLCKAMAYSPSEDVICAAWDTGYVERNTGGTTWTAHGGGSVNLQQLYWGNGRFVGIPPTHISHAYTSVDGQSWSAVSLGATIPAPPSPNDCSLAFDAAESKWYVIDPTFSGASLNLYCSAAPEQSWDAVPGVTNPNPNGGGVTRLLAYGGVLAIVNISNLWVTRNLGQTWDRIPIRKSGATAVSMAKIVGKRVVIALNDGTVYASDPFFY